MTHRTKLLSYIYKFPDLPPVKNVNLLHFIIPDPRLVCTTVIVKLYSLVMPRVVSQIPQNIWQFSKLNICLKLIKAWLLSMNEAEHLMNIIR